MRYSTIDFNISDFVQNIHKQGVSVLIVKNSMGYFLCCPYSEKFILYIIIPLSRSLREIQDVEVYKKKSFLCNSLNSNEILHAYPTP